MALVNEAHGYKVLGLLVREQRKRRRVNGKARGFYEGKYLYVRVRLVDGRKRDLYLGTAAAPARSSRRRGVEKGPAAAPAPAPGNGGGETGGRNETRAPREFAELLTRDFRGNWPKDWRSRTR